jgi:hypothetical protein
MLTKDTAIEDLVNQHPFSVNFLSEKGIRCIRCGEPVWGTLGEAAREKGFSEPEIDEVVKQLNELVNAHKG